MLSSLLLNVVATSAVVLCVVCLADVKLTYEFLNAKCRQCHPPRVVLVLILACQVSNVFFEVLTDADGFALIPCLQILTHTLMSS